MKKYILLILPIVFIAAISGTIDIENLIDYESQSAPNYINKDNTGSNAITNEGATLGRVLFYDKNISSNNSIACASCHQQQFAFSDTSKQSVGLNGGLTGRHSMRLVNSRFSNQGKFFWDERANTLEDQTTQPIQDHVEMGFSGTNGDPDINDLIDKLSKLDYYQKLFTLAFGDSLITEARMQFALAQFIRSVQSFDSKFDSGLAGSNGNINANFSNFTAEENQGKQLFLAPPPQGGAGCAGCHNPPEFDIDPNSRNNGVISKADGSGNDLTNTRAPSLRDIVGPNGSLNGPLMHNGDFTSIRQVIDHYDSIPDLTGNTNIDPRLTPGGQPQRLNLSDSQKTALEAFLLTLTGSDIYSNSRWSNPFDSNGNIEVIGELPSFIQQYSKSSLKVYPNPTNGIIKVEGMKPNSIIRVLDNSGRTVVDIESKAGKSIVDISDRQKGVYILQILNQQNQAEIHRIIRH